MVEAIPTVLAAAILSFKIQSELSLFLPPAARMGRFFTNTLFFRQTFEMKLRKNGICLTVNGLGVPPPFEKKVKYRAI
jgi:hypothetical protein